MIRSSECNFYYLNSFFDPRFSFWPLFLRWARFIQAKPVLIAPRGEFAPAALSIKSLKKKLYFKCLFFFGLLENVVWQASSNFERRDISESLFKYDTTKNSTVISFSKVKIAPDLLGNKNKIFISRNLASSSSSSSSSSNRFGLVRNLNICFASRISQMKNLDFLLKILSKVRSNIVFNIHGPAENLDYWHLCKGLIDELPSNIEVNIFGAFRNEDVEIIFGENDLFFLPTQGENFGHVIFEALKAGLPVLISDRTPWVDLELCKAGWVGSLDDPEYFVTVIERLSKMNADQLLVYRKGAREYADNYLRTNTALDETKELFKFMLT